MEIIRSCEERFWFKLASDLLAARFKNYELYDCKFL